MFGINDNQLQVEVNSDTAGFTSGMDNAVASLQGFQGAAAAAATAVGVVSTAIAGKSVQAAASFDEAMQESIAVMGDVDDAMREDLEQTARDVATSTTHSHEEAAESFYFLASAGLEAEEQLEAMPKVANLAEAGNMEMAQATDYATDIMSAFGIKAENMTEVTDALVGTVTNHNQTMNGMGEAMSMVAPVASGLGVSIEETATAIGLLGDAGIKGSRAGRTLRQAFKRLTDPPKKVQDKLDDLGVSVKDSSGEMRSMEDIIRQLEDAGADTSEIMQIFGARAGPGMQVLLDQGADALRDETEALEDMDNVAEDVAETQRDTFNKELEITRSKLNDIAISIGNDLLPALTILLDGVNTGIEKFGEWNEKTDGFLGVALLTAGALTGVAGAISLIGGASAAATPLVAGLGAVIYGLSGPVGWAILAVSLLAGAWASNMWNIRDSTYDALGDTAELLESFADDSKDVFETFRGNQEDAFNSELQARGDLPETEESREGDTEESAGDAGREDAEDYNSNYEDRLAELRDQGNPVEQFSPPEADVRTAGVQTGEEYWQGVQSGLGGQQQEIKSSGLTPAIEKALKDGVEGYKSEDLEDAPTEINEDLFNAVAATDKGASPESLGVSQEEFNALMSRHAGGGGSSSIRDIAGGITASGGGQPSTRTPSASSLGKHVKTFRGAVDEFAQAVRDMEVVVSVDDGEFGRAIDARVESNTRRTARRSGLRGVKQ